MTSEDCGSFDACLEAAETIEATVVAQKMLSTIYITGEVFGAGYVIDVLRESKNSKVLERGHDKLSCYGVGKEQSKTHWNIVIRQLLSLNYIKIKNWEYRNLALTDKAGLVLKGEEKFEMRKPSIQVLATRKNLTATIEADHGRMDLFEELRQLRLKLATDNNVPPYVIFGDKSLHDMC